MAKPKPRQAASNNVINTKCASTIEIVSNDTGYPSRLLKNAKPYSSTVETLIPNAMFIMRNTLSSAECQAWIAYAEEDRGNKWEAVSHPATKYVAHRE
ncbi:hypothetical protein HJC23_009805 [Cyclotella cryptica]|uniref:Uncharacterized protein n=1 Tax=Cyclotella cryptica TaxID=29204 RepID=A0ABD3PRG1_9STRA